MSENNLEALMGRVLGNELQRGLELNKIRVRNLRKGSKPLRRSKKRIPRKSKKKIPALKNRLTEAFQAMIRERDRDLLCIACGQKPGTQGGHFIRREILATRWHPQNVNGQCDHCNAWLHGNVYEYGQGLVQKYGEGIPEKLIALSRTSWKPSREALEALLATAKVGHEAYQETWNFYGSEK